MAGARFRRVTSFLLKYVPTLSGKKPMPMLTTGKTAPSFELNTTAGGRLAFEKGLAKGPVLLAFFKVACPTCQYTFPYLERLHRQLQEHGAQIWGIAQDNARDTAQFAKTFGVTFPILIDDLPYKTSRAYSLTHVPSLLLVGSDGQIEITSEGFCKTDLLAIQKSLAQTLSAPPAPLFLPSEKIPEYKPG
jgi:peroxiredoxin